MRKLIKICAGIVLAMGGAYGEEDPVLKFVENPMIVYPDSIWIDPEFLKYLPMEWRIEIEKWPKNVKQFEKSLKGIPEELRGSFSDIKIMWEDLINSYKWYVYWKKRGIDYDEWFKKVLKSYIKSRGFEQRVFDKIYQIYKRGIIILPDPASKFFANEQNLIDLPIYYCDLVIRGTPIKEEIHKEEIFYHIWYYFRVEEMIWSKGKKNIKNDTIIIKTPLFPEEKGNIRPHNFRDQLYLTEQDIRGDFGDFVLFLIDFPFSKLMSFPYAIYYYKILKKKGKSISVNIDSLEKYFFNLLKKEIVEEKLPEGVFESMPFSSSSYLRIYQNKVNWVYVSKGTFFMKPEICVEWEYVKNILKSTFKRREK